MEKLHRFHLLLFHHPSVKVLRILLGFLAIDIAGVLAIEMKTENDFADQIIAIQLFRHVLSTNVTTLEPPWVTTRVVEGWLAD